MKHLKIFRELGILTAGETSLASSHPLGDQHLFHDHNPLWAFVEPALVRPCAGGGDVPEIFGFLPPGTIVPQASARTRLLVFLGARMSPALNEAIALPGVMSLVFEPDLDTLEAFLSGFKPKDLAGKALFFVGGAPDSTFPPLLSQLPSSLCDMGYPVFFAQDGLAEALPEYVRRVEELLEIFYYRHAIYPLESQDLIRSKPIRPMTRKIMYDRVKHLYENLVPCLASGILNDLRGYLPGRTAILAAAGPALAGQMDFIQANSGRAVVIAVNSALKPLLAAGIEPHFVVINDTSVEAGNTLADLPRLERTILVGHVLSDSGRGAFPRTYFFGNCPGQPFPKRDGLLLHGSVITTAFSLAEYLGCVKAVLAGAQLCSESPWGMTYAPHAQHAGQEGSGNTAALRGRFPELYPVWAADGRRMYTNLNFLDVAQWFTDRIRLAKLEVINLTPGSILRGPGISLDPSPHLPESPGLDQILTGLPKTEYANRKSRVADFIREQMLIWKAKQVEAREALRTSLADPTLRGGTSLAPAEALVAKSDQDNSSYMLQRFEDFNNPLFHKHYFNYEFIEQRVVGAREFCEYMDRMATSLLKILTAQHLTLQNIE